MNRAEKYIKFLIYLAVIILINVAGITLFFRIDLTDNNIYSLSKASKQAVATLSEPMTIKVFFTENLPAPHNNTQRYLRDLLEEYAIHANEYFNYRFYDVSPKEEGVTQEARENQELAENYGIRPVEIRSVEQDEIKFKKAYMGLVLIHGDLIEKIPALTSTDQIEYELTTAINKLNNKISKLVGLDEKVNIKLIMSSSLETVAPYMGLKQLPQLPEQIKEAVAALNDKNYNQLAYDYVDPGQAGELDQTLDRYNVMSLKWPDIPEENINAGRGAIGLVMEYKDRIKEVQLMNVARLPIIGTRYELIDTENLNEIINENIETLIGINENIGYLADHGTPSLMGGMRMNQQQQGDSLRNFNMHLSESYAVKQINLAEEPIPESLNCLIIAQPTEKFSDYELFKIDQALMRGTNLAIFSDAYKEMEQPRQQQFNFNQPGHAPFDSGLKKLLAHYGVRLRDAFVMDKNCYKQTMPAQAGGGERPIYYAPVIQHQNINSELDFMKSIKGMITLQNSPLELVDEQIKAQEVTAHQLFASSGQSWLKSGKTNLNPLFMQPPQANEEFKSYPLAYLVEGEFQSYFEGKPIPARETETPEEDESAGDESADKPLAEKEAKGDAEIDLSKIESEQEFDAAGRPAKMAIVGSSALLKDNLVDQEGQSPNATFLLNIIDVLNHRSDIAAMRSKTQRFNPLDETTAMTKTGVKTVNIAGLPVLVVLFGLFTWWRRRVRRKRIQMMFQG
ncbi:MAG TPA: Gldg family protein [Desulfosalsimonadaceae bacterium]|nr:Gldg family protein [Desulfosalsimonadaceae bacterium]